MTEIFNPVSENQTLNHIIQDNNLIVSNTILHYACLDYIENYKSNLVPFNYIEYFLKYVNTYDKLFEQDLNNFYKDLDFSNLDLELLANIYSKDITSIVVTVVRNNSIEFIVTDENPIDLLSYYMESEQRNTKQKVIYENMKRIIEEIKNSDDLISKKSLYEKFMIDKFLDSYTFKSSTKTQHKNNKEQDPTTSQIKKTSVPEIKQEKVQNKQEIATQVLQTVNDKDLKGKEVDVPEQKGKVVKLFIPKLLLPSPYPILQDTSRINSDYRVKNMLKADATITLFNKHKFKAVIYSTGFIGKRKKVKKPKPKFSFDF